MMPDVHLNSEQFASLCVLIGIGFILTSFLIGVGVTVILKAIEQLKKDQP